MRITAAHAKALGLPAGPAARKATGREPRTRKPGAYRPLEKELQKAILAYLRGWAGTTWCVRVNSAGVRLPGKGGRTGFYRSNDRPGCPDILACVAGRFVAVEVKRPGEGPTDEQLGCHGHIERAGGTVIVATSVDDVADWVEAVTGTGGDRPV